MTFYRLILTSIVSVLLLAACTAQDVKQDEYSGFLGTRYSQLIAAKSPSGEEVMRWISPSFKKANYTRIIVKEPVLYPKGQANEKVSTATLNQITNYMREFSPQQIM